MIPARHLAYCVDCQEPINITAPGVAQYVTGWAANRAAGGANQIALREGADKWLCPACLDLRRTGKKRDDINQATLF